jgi:hypothetical protein
MTTMSSNWNTDTQRGVKKKTLRMLTGRADGNRILGRFKCKWEDNIKYILKSRTYGSEMH